MREVNATAIRDAINGAKECGRPTIFVDLGQLRDKVTRALGALETANNPPTLFSRGGLLTRLGRADDGSLDALDAEGILAELAEAADWKKHSGRLELDAEPSPSIIRAIRGRRTLPFPAIEAVARAPFFTAKCELVIKPGFHAAARTYLALDDRLASKLNNQDFPERPTEAKVTAARQLLLELFCDFPFADDASLAHGISLTLLPFARKMIDGPTPIHAVVAPPESAGTGKGLLVTCACVPGIGDVPCTPEVGNAEELRKKLLPVVLENLPVFLFDNVTRELKGGVLASILTARTWADRILGRSSLFRGEVKTTWVVTSNGLRVSTEIRRRTIWIRLDAGVPEPWTRGGFTHVLPIWAYEHRAELIWACVVLIRHWIACGRPLGKGTLGSFESWAAVMGGILECVGIPGFLSNASDEASKDADESGMRWQGFIEDWWHEFHEQAVLPGSLLDTAYARSIIREGKEDSLEARGRSGTIRLGLALSRRVGRAFRITEESQPYAVTMVRKPVERKGGRTDRGFALERKPQTSPNIRDIRETAKNAEKSAETKDDFSPNVDEDSRTFADDIREAQVPDFKGKSQTSRMSRMFEADPTAHYSHGADPYACGECEIDRSAAADAEDDDNGDALNLDLDPEPNDERRG